MLASDLARAVDADCARREVEAARCRTSLAHFVRRAWSIIEPGTPLVWGWHLDVICEHLQAVTDGRIKRLIVNIPPGHCKSLLVSVFWPAWEWIDRPHVRSLYGSHDPRLSARDAVKTRDLVTSAWFKETFRPAWKLKGDQNTKSFFQNSLHGSRWTFGMGGQVTGWRGDKVVVDDPLDAKNQFNAGVKDHCEFLWDNKLSSRVNNPQQAQFVLVMQRLADDDLAGRLLRRTIALVDGEGNPLRDAAGRPMVDEKGRPLRRPEYDHVCLATEFEPEKRTTTSIGWTDPRKEPGELLFPGFFNRQVVDQTKQHLGSQGFAGQHQQSPVATGGNLFQGIWFTNRLWHWDDVIPDAVLLPRDGRPAERILLQTCSTFASVDVAAGENSSNDFTVYAVWAVTPTGDILLLAERRARLSNPDSIEQAKALKQMYPRISHFVVEQNGVGLPLVQQMQRQLIPVVPISVNRDKEARATSAIIYAEQGKVFIPDPDDNPWVTAWLEEITLFPNGGHKDRVDCFTLAAEQIFAGAVATLGSGDAVAVAPPGAILRPRAGTAAQSAIRRPTGGRR